MHGALGRSRRSARSGLAGRPLLGDGLLRVDRGDSLDIAVVKNTAITERLRAQIRLDAFDSHNQVNFNNATTSLPTPAGGTGSAFVPTSSSAFGVITAGARYAPGDFGTSRQIQLSLKLIF